MLSIFTLNWVNQNEYPSKEYVIWQNKKENNFFRMMRIEPTNMTFPIGKLEILSINF